MLYLFSVAIINNGNLALGCQNIDMIVSNTRFNVDRKIYLLVDINNMIICSVMILI